MTSMLRISLLLLFFPLWLGSALGSELAGQRILTGSSGKQIRAAYMRTLNNGTQVKMVNPRGQIFTIEISNLSKEDQELITSGGKSAEPKKAPVEVDKTLQPGDPSSFKTIPPLDREELPVISQGDFGSKSSDCVPSSFCNFLLWWDQEGVLEIPQRGDFEKKAEWVHTRMARYCGTRNTAGTSVDEATEGFMKYFDKDIADLATLKIHTDYNLKPENLARYTTGEAATMLEMTIRNGPRHDSGHWVALVDAKPDGALIFHTWGARFEGKMEVLEESDKKIIRDNQTVSKTIYEIKVQNPDDLPEWFRNSDRRFILDPENWDSIYVLKPYIYAEPGKPANAPEDPYFDLDVKPGSKVVERPGQTPMVISPTEFPGPNLPYPPPSNGTLPTRKWKLVKGAVISGRVESISQEEITLVTDARKEVPVPIENFSPTDLAIAKIDAGALGMPQKIKRIRLSYRLEIHPKIITDFQIDIEGELARLNLVKEDSSLVLDSSDGAFAVIRPQSTRRSETPELGVSTIGRAELQSWTPDKQSQKFHQDFAGASLKHGSRFSGREISAAMSNAGQHANLTLSCIDLPPLQQLFAALFSQKVSRYEMEPQLTLRKISQGTKLDFNSTRMPLPLRFGAEAQVIPLEVKWDKFMITKKAKIAHTLTLLAAEIPPEFPADHFSIPADAHTMDPGTYKLAPR